MPDKEPFQKVVALEKEEIKLFESEHSIEFVFDPESNIDIEAKINDKE